ncbi:MAG: hypothetical protein ACPGVG_18440, partial [Mycobacterium sp.]
GQEPEQLTDMLWGYNLLESMGLDRVLEHDNPTSTYRNIGPYAQNSKGAPWAWSRLNHMVTSIAYNREIELDPDFAPSWWCREAVPFPRVPVTSDDRRGIANLWRRDKLPAQIRFEGGDCTPL